MVLKFRVILYHLQKTEQILNAIIYGAEISVSVYIHGPEVVSLAGQALVIIRSTSLIETRDQKNTLRLDLRLCIEVKCNVPGGCSTEEVIRPQVCTLLSLG